MDISKYTVKELEDIRQAANFTPLEMDCFNLKAKGFTNYQVAMQLNVCDSTVSVTMKSIRAKITSVIEQKSKGKPKNDNVADNLNTSLSYLLQFVSKILENTPLIPESHSINECIEKIR